jgi:Thioredoxin reductase
VVVGAESVSFSAVMTLRSAGCRTVAMVSEPEAPQTYRAFQALGSAALRAPVLSGHRVVEVLGKPRVTGVIIEEVRTGATRTLECDTVVFTADWVPDNELARSRGAALDRASLSPLVDSGFHTTVPGVYAIGNLIHPVDTGDHAALDGRRLAQQLLVPGSPVLSSGEASWSGPQREDEVRLLPGQALKWVTPGAFRPGEELPHLLGAWVREGVTAPKVRAIQGGRTIGSVRTLWPAAPGRVFRFPASVLASATPEAGPVVIDVLG